MAVRNKNGRFAKGFSGNRNGRPAGKKNRFSKEAKQMIQEAFRPYLKNLAKDLDKLDAKDRWNLMEKMLKYVMAEKTETKSKVSSDIKISYSDDIMNDFESDSETKTD